MATPEIITTTFSSLCSSGWRPLLITTLLIDWLRQHFANSATIEDPDLVNTLWKADNTSNILIESITRWKPQTAEQRLAIIVKRNDIQNQRLGIDDKLMGLNGPQSGDYYASYFLGSHTLFCIGREGAELEKLAAEVYRELLEFGKAVRSKLDLKKLQLSGIGALFKIEEAKETFAIPITVNYAFEEGWRLIKRAPVLKSIDLSIQP